MGLVLATAIRTARMEQIKTAIDAGGSAGKIQWYSSPMPSSGEAITSQTLLGTCVLSYPCGTVSNGVLTFNSITDDNSADATGTIAFGRVLDSNNNFVFDGSAGVSGEVFNFNTLSVQSCGVI